MNLRVLRLRLACMLPAVALAGCAGLGNLPGAPGADMSPANQAPGAAAGPVGGPVRLRCDDGRTLVAQIAADAVQLDGLSTGREQLLRDAGGLTPRHTVYSSPRLRAEFGLGDDGRTVLLHPLQPAAATLRCVQT